MRFLISFLLALSMSVGVAHAGWNIRQQADGSTVWVDGDGNTIPVGDAGLTTHITDLSTASTSFVVTHREGKIVKIYAVNHAALDSGSAAAVLSIGTGPGDSNGVFTPISETVGGDANHITMVTTAAGVVNSYTPADSAVDVTQGSVISINTDGGSTGTVGATVVIIIE